MNQIQIWTLAARPKTLIAGISPIFTGSVIAFVDGYCNALLFVCTLLTGLGIQIGTNFANDYFDYLKGADTSQRKGPLRVTQAGLVSLQTMKNAMFICFTLTALLGSYLVWQGGALIAFLLALSLLLAFLYTGGPFPLAYKGLGDLFVWTFFGPVATGFSYYLQTRHFSFDAWIIGAGIGAIATAILVINNIRDVEEDKIANKRTLIVRFGKTFGKIQYISLLTIGAVVPLFFIQTHPFSLLSALYFFPAAPLIQTLFTQTEGRIMNVLLAKTGQLLLIYTLLFAIGWML